MGAVYRYLRRLFALALVVLLAAVAGLLLFTRTQRFNRLVQARLAPYLATTFQGTITIGTIAGSAWADFELRDVTLRYQGGEAAHIPRVVIGYALLPLLWRTLHLRIDVQDPVAQLRRDAAGQWNVVAALSPRAPPPAAPARTSPGLALVFDTLTLNGGVIEVAPGNGARYRLLGVRAAGSVVLAPPGLRASLSTLATTIFTSGKPSADLQATLTYDETGAAPRLDLVDLRVHTARSALTATGMVRLTQPATLGTHLSVTRLAAADVAAFVPNSPLRADLSGTLDLEGPADALRSTVALTAAGAALHAQVRADVAAPTPSYALTLKLDAADLRRLLAVPGLAGIVSAELDAQGQGFTTAAITGQGKLWGRDLRVSNQVIGTAQVTVAATGTDLRATGSATGPAGAVTLAGTAQRALEGRYQLAVTTRRLDCARLGAPPTLATNLNLEATIDGRGLRPATLDTRVVVTLANSRIAGATFDRGAVDARLTQGRVQIARAAFVLEGATLELHGTGGLTPGSESNLTYNVRAASVARLFKLARLNGDGSLAVSGIVRGPQERLRTSGVMSFTVLHVGGYRADTGRISYDLAARGGRLPSGSITAEFTGLGAGMRLEQLVIAATAPAAAEGRVTVKMTALDSQGRRDHLALALDYRPPRLGGRLEEAVLALPDGYWRLAAPVSFAATPQSITLGQWRMQNGAHALVIAGTIGQAGPQDLHVEASGIDPALLATLRPDAKRYSGSLSGTLVVGGTAAQPTLTIAAAATKIAVDSHPVGDLAVKLAIRAGAAQLDAALREDQGDALTATGTLSVSISWARGVSLRMGNDLDLRVVAARVDLGRLAALAPATLRSFAGVGALDLRLAGAPARPVVSGDVRVAGVKGEIVPLGVKLTEAHAHIDLDAQQVRITNFAAAAAGGALTATGAIALHGYVPGDVAITVQFDRWPAIATRAYDAVISGALTASGSIAAPRLAGRLEVLHGTLRPPLEFLAASAQLAPDETITVIAPGSGTAAPPTDQPAPPPPSDAAPPAVVAAPRFNNLEIGLTVQIDRDTWVRHDQAQAELEGRLRLTKAAQGPLRIVGTINTVRGWIIYQQRRFDLQTGAIMFTGGPTIDPSLNIDARYTLPDYIVDVLVTGTVHKPMLQLKSQPDLAQADILALIMFGKTTAALGQGEQQSLQERAMQMAGGYAAGQIGQAVSQSLGLEGLGFQLSGISTAGGSVGFGRYIGSSTYVSASEDVGGTQGRQVSIQYYLLRWLSITTTTSSSGGSGINLNLRRQY